MTWPGGSSFRSAPSAKYHTMRLLPPPERQGRLGLYGDRHVQRLRLITRLQRRGYSLAGIRDLLGAWESGTDLVTLLGVDESQAALDETPLYLTRAELLQRLPALDEATLARAARIGLVCPQGDHFGVRSPALLGLVADWVRAGVLLDEALDLIEVFVRRSRYAGGQAGRRDRHAHLGAALGRGPGRGAARPAPAGTGFCMLQGAASTLADRIGAALAGRAGSARDGGQLLAVLDEIRVGAVADAAGTIHRVGGDR